MDQQLVLVRGLPGSGKSTFANYLSQVEGRLHLEADMYWTDEYGNYKFDEEHIEDAHHWCISETRKALREGELVIVSNCFTRPWEMQKYLDLEPNAMIIECTGKFESIHGIPNDIFENMQFRFAMKGEILERYPTVSYEVVKPEYYA